VTVAVTVYEPAKTDWVVETAPSTALTSTASVMTPDPVLTATRAAISLPTEVARDEQRRRRGALDEGGEDLGLRGDEVLLRGSVLDDVHLVRAVLGEGDLGGLGAGADVDGGGLAEAARQGEQLGGRLAELAADVVDEDENFSHENVFLSADQRNLPAARNSASLCRRRPRR
jgi:hypothetical protein